MIDWDRIDELRDEIGAEDFEEVMALFVDETEEVVGKLPHAGADALPGMLHFVKGSAENVGFREVAWLCKRGEEAIRHGEEVDRAALVASFENSCLALSKRPGRQSDAA